MEQSQNDLNDFTSKINEVANKILQHQKELNELGKKSLQEAFKTFFVMHPEAVAIVWAQYTPYFNDGDVCEFSMHDFELRVDPSFIPLDLEKKLNNYHKYDPEARYCYGEMCYATALHSYKNKQPNDQKLVDDFNALTAACFRIEDVFKSTFGDHVHVRATNKGFDISEYEHE